MFDKPGKHVVEVVDVVPADMKTRGGLRDGRSGLGQFMDPSNPTKPSAGRKFHFKAWSGPVTSERPKIELDVSADTRLTATFETHQ
jgi:hypothetical protein